MAAMIMATVVLVLQSSSSTILDDVQYYSGRIAQGEAADVREC